MTSYILSPSSLNLFIDCPRCFWLQVKKRIKRPDQIVASITNGIDLFLKGYFDYYRGKQDLPPLLEKLSLKAKLLPDQKLVDKFRKGDNFQFIDKKSGSMLYGKLDDCLLADGGYYLPLDNKTRGFPPTEIHRAHQVQMNIYTFLMSESGFKTKNIAYLVYYFPKRSQVEFEGQSLPFEVALEEVKTDSKAAQELFYEALKVLEGPLPEAGQECGYCFWGRNYLKNTKG